MRICEFHKRKLFTCIVATIVLSLLFFIITYLGWYQKPYRIQRIMQITILLGFVVIFAYRKRWGNHDWLIIVILFAGIVMRFGYALYTPTTVRFHDLAPIDIKATGHAGYVLTLFEKGTLPATNDFQYSQPPFYYMLSAFVMKLYEGLTGITNAVELFEAVRLVSCMASIATLLVAYAICQELGLGTAARRVGLAICAFLPNHYLLAGRANPDGLAVFFCFWIVLYAIRWVKIPTFHNTVYLALGFGLGMMVKMTVAVFTLPVGIFMIQMFWKECIRKRNWSFLGKLVSFIVISATLGLWHPIRNAILYGQSVINVYEMSPENPLYIGNIPMLNRYLFFNPLALFSPVFISWETGNNVILYTLKSSVFGEFSYEVVPAVPIILLCCNIVLVTLSVYATLRIGISALREHDKCWLLLILVWFAVVCSYLLFTMRYPFCCSLDYRYMVPSSLIGALALAEFLSSRSRNEAGRILRGSAYTAVIAFSISSIIMYTLIK